LPNNRNFGNLAIFSKNRTERENNIGASRGEMLNVCSIQISSNDADKIPSSCFQLEK
jgi:hypothetical protein